MFMYMYIGLFVTQHIIILQVNIYMYYIYVYKIVAISYHKQNLVLLLYYGTINHSVNQSINQSIKG
jgi:hypothetical protein